MTNEEVIHQMKTAVESLGQEDDLAAAEKELQEVTKIKDESARREGELRSQICKIEAQRMQAAVRAGLTLASINLFAPRHGRTSCSDENLVNGHYSGSNALPRCTRCGLLEAMRDGYIDPGLRVVASFEGRGE